MPRRSSSPSDPAAPLIAVGVIRRPHGVRGEASVESLTSSFDRFDELDRVFLVDPDETRRVEAHVTAVRPNGPRVLLRFAEYASPEAIKELQNWTIEVPIDEARQLEEDEVFVHDLLDLDVVDVHDGTLLGRVSDVIEGAGTLLLTVSRPGRPSFDVPFARALCPRIDLGERRLYVDLPEGLQDLEAVTATEEERIEPAAKPDPEPGAEASAPLFRVDLVTIFPGMFEPLLNEGIIARAAKNGTIVVKAWDLREFATDKHRSTDDEAYGGGVGMVMLAEPVFRCVEAIRREAARPAEEPWVVMMSPQGRRFDQAAAGELAGRKWLVVLCGRYEGFDERVREQLVDEEVSVGDFVVAGGEIPAMLVVEAVSRLIPGVVGDRNSVEADSFYNGLLDHPHYTRPAEFRGWKVPEVLVSGHAENIRKWRKEQALRATLEKRPDLLEKAELDAEARKMLARIRAEAEGGR